MPRNRTGPQSSYRLANLPSDPGGIEPPILTEGWVNNDELTNASPAPSSPSLPSSPFQSVGYNPSDVTETPYRNPILGNKDWIRENWNQYNPQDSIDDALDPWISGSSADDPLPPMDYSHPDDNLFFSPSRELSKNYDPVSINDPNAPTIGGTSSRATPLPTPPQGPPGKISPRTYGPQDFFGKSNYPTWMGAFINQYPNFPAGPIAPNEPVGQGRVLVGNESLPGDQPEPSFDLDFANAQRASQGLGPIDTTLAPGEATTSNYISRGNAPSRQPAAPKQPRIGIGSATNMNSSIGTTHNPIFGIGQQSGQHYFNDGTGWKPIGQAPADVRWAQNSGTGNWQADQTTNAFVMAGGYPDVPNMAKPDEPSTFSGGVWQLDPEGGFNQISPNRIGGPTWTYPQQGQAPSISSTDPRSIASYNARVTALNSSRQ